MNYAPGDATPCTVRLAVLGFGHVGQAFAQKLAFYKDQIRREYGYAVEVVAISTKNRGCFLDPAGIDLSRLLTQLNTTGCLSIKNDPNCPTALAIAQEVDYDVLVELTPLAIFSGQPAIDHIKTAFRRGKHVITSNKGPIAWAFHELNQLARENSSLFFYETVVMDGAPLFNLYQESLRACRVTAVDGILNTTTNFILGELAKGRSYDEILADAQARGFVETDPTLDIEGYDSAAKITALLNVLADARLTPDRVIRSGIEKVTPADLEKASTRGNVIKLLCHGDVENGQVTAWVRPVEIPKTDLMATINGTSAAVSITTDLIGKLTIVEHNPSTGQSAYGLLSDLFRLLSRLPR